MISKDMTLLHEAELDLYKGFKELLMIDYNGLKRHCKGMIDCLNFTDMWLYCYHKESAKKDLINLNASRAYVIKRMLNFKKYDL